MGNLDLDFINLQTGRQNELTTSKERKHLLTICQVSCFTWEVSLTTAGIYEQWAYILCAFASSKNNASTFAYRMWPAMRVQTCSGQEEWHRPWARTCLQHTVSLWHIHHSQHHAGILEGNKNTWRKVLSRRWVWNQILYNTLWKIKVVVFFTVEW